MYAILCRAMAHKWNDYHDYHAYHAYTVIACAICGNLVLLEICRDTAVDVVQYEFCFKGLEVSQQIFGAYLFSAIFGLGIFSAAEILFSKVQGSV